MDKLTPVAWLFGTTLVSGLLMALAGKSLQVPLTVIHKLLALVCLLLLIRAAVRAGTGHPPHAPPAAIAVFAAAFLVSFATGVLASIPACAGALWLNLHRVAAAVAAIAARLIAIAARP